MKYFHYHLFAKHLLKNSMVIDTGSNEEKKPSRIIGEVPSIPKILIYLTSSVTETV
jgi:hypothetical protein